VISEQAFVHEAEEADHADMTFMPLEGSYTIPTDNSIISSGCFRITPTKVLKIDLGGVLQVI